MRELGNEILEDNKVSMTLFVGVGGIGSRIIKGVAEKCSDTELDNINFVVFDTNANDLEDIRASETNMYFVQTSSTSTVGDYLREDSYAFDHWFPKNSVMYAKSMTDGAGQVRAISRLALNSTIRLNRLKPLYDAIDDLYRKTGEALKYELRIVIASSANGGTGSGMVLPIAMLLRKYINEEYPTTTANIRSMILLPGVQNSEIKSITERMSLRRNAYATIKEINAFMMKGSGFFDNTPELNMYSDIHVKVSRAGSDQTEDLDMLPFNFCFLLDGQDAEDKTSITQEQYIDQAAMCLYEQNIGPMKKNSFGIEDNIVKELSNKTNYGRNRFGGLGASIIKYPYESIVEYVADQWVIDKMAGKDTTENWCQYDKEWERKRKEQRADGVDEDHLVKIWDSYVSQMETNKDDFSKTMRTRYIDKIKGHKLRAYFTDLEAHVNEVVSEKSGNSVRNATTLKSDLQASSFGNATDKELTKKIGRIETFENFTKNKSKEIAQQEAESIFWNRSFGKKDNPSYYIESLLKNREGLIHPNAIRYVLYKLQIEMEERLEKCKSNIENRSLRPEKFDVLVKQYKTGEQFMPQSNNGGETNEVFEKPKKLSKKEKEELGNETTLELNNALTRYRNNIKDYLDNVIMHEVYSVGLSYIGVLNAQFEEFYGQFEEKTKNLIDNQEDLAISLKYVKGTTVYNVCGDKECLERIASETKPPIDEDALPEDLCAKIFDAIKKNARIHRFNNYAEPGTKQHEKDIFDEIIIEHFIETVKNKCTNLDLNILDAIKKECILKHEINMEKKHKPIELDDLAKERKVKKYINKIIEKGDILAAPGIQRMANVEPREINLCAYNESLDNLRQYNTSIIFKDHHRTSTDTISKYEIHFFNAIYNITPDRLRKFACDITDKKGRRDAGMYYSAYQEYSSDIGPDSEKCKVISTHIDKRWDSVYVLPEIDMNNQEYKLKEIQRAFVYSLLYGIVQFKPVSQKKPDKKNYFLENCDEHLEEMVVSNGTPCDELYEVLDHFYISAASVKEVLKQIDKHNEYDINKKVSFNNTVFAEKVNGFRMPGELGDPISVFDIVMKYYLNIPNAKRYEGEIDSLVQAIISVFDEQIKYYENKNDQQQWLWDLLVEQYFLILKEYGADESLSQTEPSQHPVIDSIYRGVKNVLTEELNRDVIKEMRNAKNNFSDWYADNKNTRKTSTPETK